MSSKPGAGINHKEYGVTSEGVTVFLDTALRHIGIEPRSQPFTVKITGGPDGDVAGNEIKILDREYGANARIVGIADGSGCAEDPDGLDHEELLRLVKASLPIRHFDRSKLSTNGRVVTLDDPDGVQLRNTLHNRVIADAFIPAGGRPNAIHAGNWKQFLTKDGTPSSRLIVEGANLFLTPEARRHLSERGVLIIKDSSANKCGVICSSFEISACMVLDEAEFLAIKEEFVEEVLDKLRHLARREAELLLRVHRHHPHIPLPDMSARLSHVMIRAGDAIHAALDHLVHEAPQLMRKLVVEHLPPILFMTAGERLWEKIPDAYLRSIMAKALAARIVYRESFEALEMMPMGSIAEFALRYLLMEQEREKLISQVAASSLPDRQRITQVLSHSSFLPLLGRG
jgi:glutamate dehydrogenase